jgi:hypothetical protein
VHALSCLARIGRVADGAWLPVFIFVKLAFEVEGMVDAGEAEFDVVALILVLVLIKCRLFRIDLHPVQSCPA